MDNLIEKLDGFFKKEVKIFSTKQFAIALFFALLIGFFIITLVIQLYSPEKFEASFSQRLQEYRSPVLDGYMITVSFFGERPVAITMIACTMMFFIVLGHLREGLYILMTSISSIINYFLKILINRPRPTEDLVEVLIMAENQSFPSGHTVHFVVFFGMLMVLIVRIKRIKAWLRLLVMFLCLILIVSIPFSRVYLGAHWTTDVMAGLIVGVLMLFILLYFYFRQIKPRYD